MPEELTPDSGWIEAPELGVYRQPFSFVTGDPEGDRLRVRYWTRSEDLAYVGKVWFGPRAEGPPLCAHGGAIAAVLDDCMGRCLWVAGHKVLAGKLEFSYRSRTPLLAVHSLEAKVDRIEGRKVFAVCNLKSLDGTLRASGSGLFIQIDETHLESEKAKLQQAGHPTWSTELTPVEKH